MVLDAFIKTGIFYFLGLLMFIYGYVRIMSKNYDKRAAQNRWFMEHTAGVLLCKARPAKIAIREVSFMDFNKNKEMGLEYAEKRKNAALDLAEKG